MNISLNDWTPARLAFEAGAWKVNWCLPGREAHFGAPFWLDDVARWTLHPCNLLFGVTTGPGALQSLANESPGLKPSGLIFHLSRCGSTLLSQMLAASEKNLVVSEAVPLDVALRARSFDAALSEREADVLFGGMASVLGRPRRESEERFFLKLDAWHMLEWRRIAALFPDVPWVFVWRDPVEILVSHARRPGMQMRPDVLPPSLFGLEQSESEDVTDYRAQVLGRIAQCAAEALNEWPGGRPVDYASLPSSGFEVIESHFGVVLDEQERDYMETATRVHAKAPSQTFVPDSERKQAEATPEQRDACARWAMPHIAQIQAFLT
ncbi:hypothetical protein EON83_03170 [bacterium]|nr:MAG: hypothetical protein EON83_03170 [bacterium]